MTGVGVNVCNKLQSPPDLELALTMGLNVAGEVPGTQGKVQSLHPYYTAWSQSEKHTLTAITPSASPTLTLEMEGRTSGLASRPTLEGSVA